MESYVFFAKAAKYPQRAQRFVDENFLRPWRPACQSEAAGRSFSGLRGNRWYFSTVLIIFLFLFNLLQASAVDLQKEGRALFKKGKLRAAIQRFEEARRVDPQKLELREDLATAYNNLGVVLCENKDYVEAERVFRSALKILPDNQFIKRNLARALSGQAQELYSMGKRVRAKEKLRSAVGLEKDAQVCLFLARILYEQGENEAAHFWCKEVLELDEQNEQALEMMGKLKKEEGMDTIISKHFKVRFTPRLSADTALDTERLTGQKTELIDKIIQRLEAAWWEIGTTFSYYPEDNVSVIIYQGEDFKSLDRPDWTMSLYDGKMRLKEDDVSQEMDRVVFHEYTHALLHFLGGKKIPIWLHEGLAQYFEPNSRLKAEERLILSEALKEKKFLSLTQLDEVFKKSVQPIHSHKDSLVKGVNQQETTLAYLEAKSLVFFLINHFGQLNLIEMTKLIANPDRTLLGQSGKSKAQASSRDSRPRKKQVLTGRSVLRGKGLTVEQAALSVYSAEWNRILERWKVWIEKGF